MASYKSLKKEILLTNRIYRHKHVNLLCNRWQQYHNLIQYCFERSSVSIVHLLTESEREFLLGSLSLLNANIKLDSL